MGAAHAIGLGLCVLVTELACTRERERDAEGPSLRRIVVAVVLASIIGLFIASVGQHMCDEGDPLQQWLIPSVCMGFAIACIRDARRRFGLVAFLALVSFGLTLHYGALVHGHTFIGRSTPSWSMAQTHPDRLPEQAWHTPLTGLYRR